MTTVESVAALGIYGACAVRVTRLGPTCAPLGGDNNAAIFAAMATGTLTPDVKEGARIEPEDACGNISWTDTQPDVTKRYTAALEFNVWDFAAAEIMTDASVILGATGGPWEGKIIGIERAGSQTPHKDGFALEIWSKTALGDGACGDAEDIPPYLKHIVPRMYLRTDDVSFQNDVITMKFSGWGSSNGQWGEGPWGDWEGTTGGISATTPYVTVFAQDIPDLSTGYLTVPS